jgi:membrane protease YdiL (CAAX protease family)
MDIKKFTPDAATGCLSDDDTKAYFSRLGFSVFGLGLAYFLGAMLIGTLATSIFPPEMLKDDLIATVISYIISIVALYCIGLPIFKAISAPLPSMRPFKSSMRFSSFLGGFCIAMLAMDLGNYASNMVLVWLYNIFGISPENPLEEAVAPNDPAMVIVTFAFVVILMPVLEELLFRRILCAKLLPLGEGYAIVLSGAVFGLIHGNVYQFAYGFLVGALFAFIYIKTGKLIYSIIYHMVINFLGMIVAPWIMTLVDMDKLYAVLESGTTEIPEDLLMGMSAVMLYSAFTLGLAIVGVVLFFKAKKKNRLVLERGILPPPKKHRIANLFCNVGVAAAITFFVIFMLVSLK